MAIKANTIDVDLGVVQRTFRDATKAWAKTERALKLAQDARDKAKTAANAAETALRDATRTVLG